jgi:hypothetical protein
MPVTNDMKSLCEVVDIIDGCLNSLLRFLETRDTSFGKVDSETHQEFMNRIKTPHFKNTCDLKLRDFVAEVEGNRDITVRVRLKLASLNDVHYTLRHFKYSPSQTTDDTNKTVVQNIVHSISNILFSMDPIDDFDIPDRERLKQIMQNAIDTPLFVYSRGSNDSFK